MTTKAPRGVRLVIALAGRRNAGKSSLINAICGQEIAIVSEHAGTTTDPVAKHYELHPIGPVTFYDTAGLDDEGELGQLRIKAARKVLLRTDVAIVVAGEDGITDYERKIIADLKGLEIPFIVALNKTDLSAPRSEDGSFCEELDVPCLAVSATNGTNINALKKAIVDLAPEEFRQDPVLVRDLVSPGDFVVCVCPIDSAAPKGRLILPQTQVLRDILDANAIGIAIKETELETTLAGLTKPAALVITDSQVVDLVDRLTPQNISLTTFSTLFARYKGDLDMLIKGAETIDSLDDGDTVLIGEACSHHATSDDIGRVKLPNWMRRYTGKDLNFEVYAGHDFPEDLEEFKLAVHCGGCMINRMEMLRRIRECNRRGVPITNYGVAISKLQGVLERIIRPFGK